MQTVSETCFLTSVSAVIYGKDSKRGVEQEDILCQEGMHEGINDWFRNTTYHGAHYGYSSQDHYWSHPSHSR